METGQENQVREKVMCEDGSSVIVWKVYPPDVKQDTIEEDFEYFDGYHIYSAYDCTGKWFADGAHVKRTKTRCLVTQWWGMDI